MDSAIDYLINNYENHEMLRTNVIWATSKIEYKKFL